MKSPFDCLSFEAITICFSWQINASPCPRLRRRILPAPNRAHPVGKIGNLLIDRLSLNFRAHALKLEHSCPGKHGNFVLSDAPAKPIRHDTFSCRAADQERQDDWRMMLQKSARLNVGSL